MGMRGAFNEWWRDLTLNRVVGSSLLPRKLRPPLLRALGLAVGGGSSIAAGCFIGSKRLTIGEGVSINYGCFFSTPAPVYVGDRCNLGPQVMVCSSTHEPGDGDRRAGANASAPVWIGPGSWIGARVTILPGVTVGYGCVVAAGAVVTEDCAPNGVYAGVPARRVKDLPSGGRELDERPGDDLVELRGA